MYPNLKLQIFRLGIHQNHIARSLGMDESVLSKIIHGYRQPSQEQREQLADFLKVEENWLFEKYEAMRHGPAPIAAAPEAEQKDGLS
jgi:transcriptional regulator with XRE-family HTH domain